MYDTPSLFDVLDNDDRQVREASRKALALAHTRADHNLGRFLRAAQSEEEFIERLALVQGDLDYIVQNSSAEVGHEHPEHIATALKDHFHHTANIKHACGPCGAGKCKNCSGGECSCGSCGGKQSSINWRIRNAKGFVPFQKKDDEEDGDDDSDDSDEEAPKGSKKVVAGYRDPAWDGAYEPDDVVRMHPGEYEEYPPEPPSPPTVPPQGYGGFHGGDEVPRGHPDEMDYQGYDPEGGQPCPHGPHWRHCPECNPGGQTGANPGEAPNYYSGGPTRDRHPSERDYYGAKNPGESDPVTCPECGGDGKTAGAKPCGKCRGEGKVPNFGDSMVDNVGANLARTAAKCSQCGGVGEITTGAKCTKCEGTGRIAADGNTGLDGPEPKMNKGLWTPQSVKKPTDSELGSDHEEKDIIEPIKATNDDALKEMGEAHCEKETLPSEKENAGFQDGGETKGPEKWQGGDSQADPVTRDKQSSANPLQVLLNQPYPSDEAIRAAFSRLK